MVANNDNIESGIRKGLAGATVKVEGDGRHFEALVICDGFAGKNRVMRHQMVYAALGERMKEEIHALSIRAYTTEEYHSLSH